MRRELRTDPLGTEHPQAEEELGPGGGDRQEASCGAPLPGAGLAPSPVAGNCTLPLQGRPPTLAEEEPLSSGFEPGLDPGWGSGLPHGLLSQERGEGFSLGHHILRPLMPFVVTQVGGAREDAVGVDTCEQLDYHVDR